MRNKECLALYLSRSSIVKYLPEFIESLLFLPVQRLSLSANESRNGGKVSFVSPSIHGA
jgi:hypothetical protein